MGRPVRADASPGYAGLGSNPGCITNAGSTPTAVRHNKGGRSLRERPPLLWRRGRDSNPR